MNVGLWELKFVQGLYIGQRPPTGPQTAKCFLLIICVYVCVCLSVCLCVLGSALNM